MSITSAKYVSVTNEDGSKTNSTVIGGVEWSIPLNLNNRHYQEVLQWAAIDGNNIIDNGGGE